MRNTLLLATLTTALLFSLPACDSGGGSAAPFDTAGSGGVPDTGPPAGANCGARCQNTAARCGAPGAIAIQTCAGLCDKAPTEAQLICLEGESCQSLMGAMGSGGTVCDIGVPGGSSSTATDAGSSSGGGKDATSSTQQSCKLGTAPKCDDDWLVSCKEIAGVPAVERLKCGFRCKGAKCIYSHTLCKPKWSEGSSCSDDCDGGAVYTGDHGRYCSSTCGPEDECPAGHGCKKGTPSICVPTCQSPNDCADKNFISSCAEGLCG